MFRWICPFVVYFLVSTRSQAIEALVTKALFYKHNVATGKKYIPFVDLSWQIKPSSLHFYTNNSGKIVAGIRTDIVFENEEGIISEDHFILQTPPCDSAAELDFLKILELRHYDLVPGKVKISLTLTDIKDSSSRYVFLDSVNTDFEDKNPFFSDIQMLDTSVKSSSPTPFLKNGVQQIPLSSNFLDGNRRKLHYYAELYGAEFLNEDQFPLVQRVMIRKKENEEYLPLFVHADTFTKKVKVNATGSFPVGTLTSGNYFVVITLEDKFAKKLAVKSLFFQRLNLHPDKPLEAPIVAKDVFKDTAVESLTVVNLDKTFMAKYSLAQVKAMLKMLLPLSDPMQANTISGFLKRPNEMYMRYFVYNYFVALDSKDPAKAWKEYADKVRYVNKKFTENGTAGYETERGFIYLRYGAPTDVVVVPNETGAMPYEIWQYNNLTQFTNKKELPNALFLFYKPNQTMTEYRILHSTVPGEMINLSWRQYLYSKVNSPNASGTNTNSKAEQFFGNR